MTDYLQRILRARVYDVARETPLDPAPNLSRRLNNTVWLKREDLQPVFSFKLRGAYNRMAQLSRDELKRGVIASSAGNPLGGTGMAAVGVMRAKPGASARNSTAVTKNGVAVLPNSASTAPGPGAIRRPAVRTPISWPSSSPARSGSRVVTKACGAGSNAPGAAPLIARAATND